MSDFTLMSLEEVSRSDVLREAVSAYDNKTKRAKAVRWVYVIAGIAVAAILFFISLPIAVVALIVALVLAAISGKPAKKKLRATALGAFAGQIGFDYIANGDGPCWYEASKQFSKNLLRVECGDMFQQAKAAGFPPAAYYAKAWDAADGGETSTPSMIFDGTVYVLPRSNPGSGVVVIVPRGYKKIDTAKVQQVNLTEAPLAARFDVYASATTEAQRFLENGRFMDATAQLPRASEVLIYANAQAILVALIVKSLPASDVKLASPGEAIVRDEYARFSETMSNLQRLQSALG